MARTISQIKSEMIDTKNSLPALADLTSTSQVSIFGNIFHVTAVSLSIFEQFIDAFIVEIETIVNEQAIGSTPWIRAKILEFQYTDYVVLDTVNLTIAYAEVNEALKIITRCSVKETGNLIIQAKVAKSDPPGPLDALEQTALNDYLDILNPAGIQINVVSLESDKLYIVGTIFYSGQYSSVIEDNVKAALATYMENLSSIENFDGIVRITEVYDAIQAVAGVVDVSISEIGARANTVDFANRTNVFKLSTGENNVSYETVSGYIVEETESGATFTDTLLFTAI